MKKVFTEEIWSVGMFSILALVYFYAKRFGLACDMEAIELSLCILGMNLGLKFYPVIYLAVMRSIPDKE